jgi:hypothetical protein
MKRISLGHQSLPTHAALTDHDERYPGGQMREVLGPLSINASIERRRASARPMLGAAFNSANARFMRATVASLLTY